MLDDRNQWIDILKGIGILFIVIGHIVSGPLRDFLYLFHVPIFFFLSGYLFKKPISKKSYILKKTTRLLVPYFSFLSGFTIILILATFLINNDTDNLIVLIESALLGGQSLTGWLSVFWFITSLFFTQVIYVYLQGLDRKLFYSCILISLALAYTTSIYTPDVLTFWSLNTVLFTLPIYFAGNLCASYRTGFLPTLSILAIAFILPFYYMYPSLYNIDIKQAEYGMPVIALILSLSLVIITFSISRRIKTPRILANSLAYLGGMSMTIMYMHQPIQITLRHHLHVSHSLVLIVLTISFCAVSHQIFNANTLFKRLFTGI
jgi:fucose 4-O-acetylase-like acetyltransferase